VGADGWLSGVDVVDLGARKVIRVHLRTCRWWTTPMPPVDRPDGGWLRSSGPPSGALDIAQERGILTRGRHQQWPGRGGRWGAAIASGEVGSLTEFPKGEGTLDPLLCAWPLDEGFATDDIYTAFCGSPGVVRRVTATGEPIGDVTIDQVDGDSYVTSARGPDGMRYLCCHQQE
jgi:hypothetical protein